MERAKDKELIKSFREFLEQRGSTELKACFINCLPELDRLFEEFLKTYFPAWELAELSKIFEVSQILRHNVSVEQLMQELVRLVHDYLGFRIVLLSLLTEDGQHYRRVAYIGLPWETFERLSRQLIPKKVITELFLERYRISKSFFIREKVPPQMEPFTYTPTPKEKSDDPAQWKKDDMLVVPIYGDAEEIIGFFTVDEPVDGKVPTKTKITTLEIFSALAGLTIKNYNFYRDLQEKLIRSKVLFEISSFINSALDLDEILRQTTRTIRENLGYLWVGVLMKDERTETLYVRAQSGLEDERFKGVRFETGKDRGMAAEVAITGRCRFVNDLEKYDGPYIPFIEGAQSASAIPIKKRGRVLGVIDIESKDKNVFGPEERKFFRTVANQLGGAIENFQTNEKLKKELKIRTALSELTNLISSVLELDRLLRTILDLLRSFFSYWDVAIYLMSEDGQELILKSYVGYEFEEKTEVKPLKVGKDGIQGIVAATGKPLNIGDVRLFPIRSVCGKDVKSELAVPIKKGNKIMGVLDIQSPKLNAFDDEDVRTLEMFAPHIAIAIDNAQLYEKMRELAITDGMTGLYNYRHFMQTLHRELNRALRFGHPLVLMMLDIDDFKIYNDTLGHPAGDEALKAVANIMLKSVRAEIDFPARYGGEEFAIILPEIDKKKAARIAERIRKRVEAIELPGLDKLPLKKLSVSIGLASAPEDGESPARLIKSADQALYRAKCEGKNRVIIFEKQK